MRELAGERKRFGSPRLHIMLKREGLVVNHKRTERIYREEGLGLRRKRRRKGAAGARDTLNKTYPRPDCGCQVSFAEISGTARFLQCPAP